MSAHEQQRKEHLARQARSDALKQLKAGEEVWVTVPDFDTGKIVRCRVTPFDHSDVYFSFYGGKQALCLVEHALQVALIVEKDGTKVYNSGYHLPDKSIFGIVAESHPVDP